MVEKKRTKKQVSKSKSSRQQKTHSRKTTKLHSYFTNLKQRFIFFKEFKTYIHKHPLFKFIIVFFLFAIYFFFATKKYGLEGGLLTGVATWSFFVFCTPVADAGALLDFPVRFLTGMRMVYSEMMVWVIATLLNIYLFVYDKAVYQNNLLLKILEQIIEHPFPYAIIVLLSAGGTFFSVLFGDEILDVISGEKEAHTHRKKHHNKFKIIVTITILVSIIILYYILINQLGIEF